MNVGHGHPFQLKWLFDQTGTVQQQKRVYSNIFLKLDAPPLSDAQA